MKKNNKGFSLVELIIVIAIMAILVGVMAPQLIKYIEKSKVSSDKSLCDTVRSAVSTALLDPDVNDDDNYSVPSNGTYTLSDVIGMKVLGDEVKNILGTDAAGTQKQLKSKKAKKGTIQVILGGDGDVPNQVTVYVKEDPTIKAGPADTK